MNLDAFAEVGATLRQLGLHGLLREKRQALALAHAVAHVGMQLGHAQAADFGANLGLLPGEDGAVRAQRAGQGRLRHRRQGHGEGGAGGGLGGRLMRSLGPFNGVTQPDPPVGPGRRRECRWDPCVEFTIPEDWLSGVYVGKLTAREGGWQSYVVFIVRDDRRADLIFQCSDTTWQAYNRWPDRFALYDNGEKEWYWGPEVQVSFRRPYGKYCQILDQPLSIGSGEWFLWEFPFAFWMESLGLDVTYCSNLDTHRDPAGLLRAKGFLSVGHDEYWTIEMFRNVRAAVEALERALGTRVRIVQSGGERGRIEVEYYSQAELDRLYYLLAGEER